MSAVTRDGRQILEVIAPDLRMIHYEKITDLGSKKQLTLPASIAPVEAHIRVEGQAVRYRADGPDPTATDGMLVAVGETLRLRGTANMAAIEFIEATAGATLHVSYWA